MQLEYAQESAVDMSRHQLEVMWNHFRVLDSERMHFEKPPSTWRPPDVRDMNDDELNAYWNGFRQIMQSSSANQGDDLSIVPHSSSDVMVPSESAPVQPAAGPTRRRLRGKQPPPKEVAKVLVQKEAEKGVKCRSKRGRPVGSGSERNKVTKGIKVKVARNGKSESISIWKKVQLFKESYLRQWY